MHFSLPVVQGEDEGSEVSRTRFIVLPGEFLVCDQPSEIFTLLGSCVSACLFDSRLKIAGLNHFLLPELPDGGQHDDEYLPLRYGVQAMEELINAMMRRGSRKQDMVAKVFGGANLTGACESTNVGKKNSEFVVDFLKRDDFRITGVDLGGNRGRRIILCSDTGKVRVYLLNSGQRNIIKKENEFQLHLREGDVGGTLEFFTD